MYDNSRVTHAEDWSPADNPYAIAVSEAQWWREAVHLTITRMRRNEDRPLGAFSSKQIDARYVIIALRQILTAEQLEQDALSDLGIDRAVQERLQDARRKYEELLPGITHMRNALTHFDAWSRGKGHGPQAEQLRAGQSARDVARTHWGFSFDPRTDTVLFGVYALQLNVAESAARDLCAAIYTAAREVDSARTTRRRAKVVDALSTAGKACDTPGAVIKVSPGHDTIVWLSLDMPDGEREGQREDVAARIVGALSSAGMRLIVPTGSDPNAIQHLAHGEPLYAEDA